MYSVKINNGQYTFDETTRWYTHDRAEILENGATAFYEQMLQIDGELIGAAPDPATDVQAKFRALKTILFLPAPIKIEIINLDTGKTEVTYLPANYIATPKMRELVQVPTDGADQASHIKYHASFYIKKPSLGDQQKDTAKLNRSVEEISLDGNLQKKIWRASATMATLQASEAAVLSFAPTGLTNLTTDFTTDYDTNTFTAVWTWEKTSDEDAFTFSCEVTFTKSGHGWNEAPVIGTGKKPNFHRNRYRAGTITVRYKAQALLLAKIVGEPVPHFTESDELFRDKTKEPPAQRPKLDPITGIYTVEHTEYWYFTAEITPYPNHSSHAAAFPKTGPKSARLG